MVNGTYVHKSTQQTSCQNEFLHISWLFFFFSPFTVAEECFMNCYCEEYRSECTLRTCLDDINTENMEEIVINGKLCQSHRYTLTYILQDTLIILKEDLCEDIPNCQ